MGIKLMEKDNNCHNANRIITPKLVILLFTFSITACQSDNPPNNQATPQSSTKTTAVKNTPSQAAAKNAEVAGQAVADKLSVSYARAAAYTPNECPKLVEFQFNNQSITRQDERFPQQQCEYFVYLRAGDKLNVHVSNDVRAQLVSPINFDFAKGDYTADKYDKYTVRLSYDGTRYHPQNFKYDVILTKSNSQAGF